MNQKMVLLTGKGKDTEYHIEKILAERIRWGQEQVLIKWKEYPDSFNSWEPVRNLI